MCACSSMYVCMFGGDGGRDRERGGVDWVSKDPKFAYSCCRFFWLMRENMIAVVGPSNKTHLNNSTMQTYNECVETCREQKRTDARSENKLKG